MLALTARQRQFGDLRVAREATCWRVRRIDGVELRFTDHNDVLIVDGLTYTPTDGMGASARQHVDDMTASNVDIRGVLSSAAITMSDILAGNYREATVTEMTVDWRYPFLGAQTTEVYTIGEIKFDTDGFEAQLSGTSGKLRFRAGRTLSRTCPWRLYDGRCQADATANDKAGTVTSVSSTYARRIFTDTSLIGDGANVYTEGQITWETGANAGLTSDIKWFDDSTGKVTLYLDVPADIVAADTYTIYKGCNRIITICDGRFSNTIHFGGAPTMTGSDTLSQGPNRA